jgi:cobalt-zinc-cadmium efflux system outer membrane protein
MSPRRLLTFCGVLVLLSGCLYHAREQTDATVAGLAAHPFDLGPPLPPASPPSPPPPPEVPAASPAAAGKKPAPAPGPPLDVETTAFMQAEPESAQSEAARKRMERVRIPPEVPGSEAEFVKELPKDEAAKRRLIARLYPDLPLLPEPPAPLPGPDGHAYTLADLQQLAAANSPALRKAASDVEAARGNLIQARVYPNPTVGWVASPSNDGETPGVQGPLIQQTVRVGGKQKLQAEAAEMDLRNAELALKRARSDLATQVRNAYCAVLVAQETVRVTRALARFTDEIYLLQRDLLVVQAAAYEPAGLRAQTYTARLAYKQAIQTYVYAWKQLVAAVGLRQLPLTQVAGRLDAAIPYYDYDAVLAHVLRSHTDVLTARNGIDKARYNLKAAQVTPVPDVNFQVIVQKEFALPPFQWCPSAQVTFPLPIWDQNKGAIIAAEAALVSATEEPHRVEVTLTSNLATAYAGYKNNLDALEYYRRFILPDQVRYYRGVLERRRLDPSAAFGDLVAAQQTLATDVTTYLTILGQLWTSVVSVADFLQTDDLFQLAPRQVVPELPDLEQLPVWPCPHPAPAVPPAQPFCAAGQAAPAPGAAISPAPDQGMPPQTLPEPRRLTPPEAAPPSESGAPGPVRPRLDVQFESAGE